MSDKAFLLILTGVFLGALGVAIVLLALAYGLEIT